MRRIGNRSSHECSHGAGGRESCTDVLTGGRMSDLDDLADAVHREPTLQRRRLAARRQKNRGRKFVIVAMIAVPLFFLGWIGHQAGIFLAVNPIQ